MEEGVDKRRKNLPTADEIAGLIPNPVAQADENRWREIVLAKRSADGTVYGWHKIQVDHPAYFPLAYLLIFPAGGSGWDKDLLFEGESIKASKEYGLFSIVVPVHNPRACWSSENPFSSRKASAAACG